jgi:hypothetical protein
MLVPYKEIPLISNVRKFPQKITVSKQGVGF